MSLLVKRSVTARMIAANRLNARKSTGPRTEAGKESVRMNALRQGNRSEILFGRFVTWYIDFLNPFAPTHEPPPPMPLGPFVDPSGTILRRELAEERLRGIREKLRIIFDEQSRQIVENTGSGRGTKLK